MIWCIRVPSRSRERGGRPSSRTWVGCGGRRSVGHANAVAGRMLSVSDMRRADERRWSPAKPIWAKQGSVRRKRVILAVDATVKPCGGALGLNRVRCIANSQGDGDKKEVVAGEQLCRSRPVIERAQGWRCAPPPPAADGLDPARPAVFRRCMRSAEAERGRSLRTGWRPISLRARS